MGLFSFIKDAGAKLFHKDTAATPDALQTELKNTGLDTSKVQVAVEGGKVKLTGSAKTQEEAEKIILAAGNVNGVDQVDTSGLKVDQAASESTFYTVQKGDTLWKIAEKHLGDGSKYPEIVKANTPPVKDPDLIQPGWVLRIPGSKAASSGTSATA